MEWRTLPAVGAAEVVAEVQGLVDRLAAADESFRATVRPKLARPGFELPGDAPVARALRRAVAVVLGTPPAEIGVAYWMRNNFV